jgi:hypothetical protein
MLLAAALVAPAAAADGLPVLGVDVGSQGVTTPSATVRYVTIPAVAYDGTADGLSADGKTLVLIQSRARYPRVRTLLAVFDAARLRVRGIVELQGDYSFDAISPDGGTVYLIHYLSPRDPTSYEVRAYDLRSGRLLPDPIVDPQETGEEMRGNPVTRAASPDGRWAYTLYDGAGGMPFVHALDTVAGAARCIDLDLLAGRKDIGSLRLALRGRTLGVVGSRGPIAVIDTGTFAVRRVLGPPPAADRSTGHGVPWLPIGVLAGLGILGAAGLVAIRRPRLTASSR